MTVEEDSGRATKSHNHCWLCSADCLTSEFIRIGHQVPFLKLFCEHSTYSPRALHNYPFGARTLPAMCGVIQYGQSTTRKLYPSSIQTFQWSSCQARTHTPGARANLQSMAHIHPHTGVPSYALIRAYPHIRSYRLTPHTHSYRLIRDL